MRVARIVAVVALLVGLGFVVNAATCHQSATPTMALCSAEALAANYHGIDAVDSVQGFGCVGGFAFLWATIGKGEQEIGVTEVLKYDEHDASWHNVSRLTYCDHHRLPHYVEYWGCNSN